LSCSQAGVEGVLQVEQVVLGLISLKTSADKCKADSQMLAQGYEPTCFQFVRKSKTVNSEEVEVVEDCPRPKKIKVKELASSPNRSVESWLLLPQTLDDA